MQKNIMSKADYLEKIDQLKRRNGELKGQHTKAVMEQKAVYKTVSTIQSQIKKLNAQNVELSQRIEEKIIQKNHAQKFSEQLSRDLNNLELSHLSIQSRYNEKVKELHELEAKLNIMMDKKERYQSENSETASALKAIKVRKENIIKNILSLDEQLKIYEQRLNKEPIDQMLMLKENLKSHAGKDESSAAMVLTLVDSIVKNIQENEFENLTYRFKVNSNSSKLGVRVQFSGVASTHDDIKERIYPLMKSYKAFINEMGIQIKTKVIKTKSGMVNTLDIAVVAPKEDMSRVQDQVQPTHKAPRANM